VRELLSILAGPMPMGRLDIAALELATLEHPGLDIARWLGVLDEHARALGQRVNADAPGDAFIDAAGDYLFREQGFTGDTANYYDPRNSCLNHVLESRTGIPITLAVVYMEVARRLARPVYGVGLPGHFLALYDDGNRSVYLDPFNGGTRLTEEECFALARRATGAEVEPDRSLLAPVTHRQILLRMINNLRAVHLQRRNYPGALRVLDFVLGVYPEAGEEYKLRGVVYAKMGKWSAARADLRRYLQLAPAAPDRQEVEEHLAAVQRRLAGLN
jgi:regulator of sirC expression with transglutaminase-like and TPR domain